jgi:Flp pilus assembly pilin Flp
MFGRFGRSNSAGRRPVRRETGAAAVEFGLISPLIFAILFGTMTYGLWFNDALNLRQGLREASRQGVVGTFGTDTSCGATYAVTPSTNMQKLVCDVKREVSALTGETYVKVLMPGGWVRGQELVVCGMVHAEALPKIVPLPSDRMIRFQSRMSIEEIDVHVTETGGEEVPPSGTDWAWCTP